MARQPAATQDKLDLDQDRRFSERWWKAERVVWCAFGLVGLAALLGLTGSGGWLADATVQSSVGSVEYPRVTRWQADDSMQVEFAASGATQRRLTLSSEFTALFVIVDIEPRPVASAATAAGEVLTFEVGAQGAGRVSFQLRAQHPGYVSYFAQIEGERLPASTVVLP